MRMTLQEVRGTSPLLLSNDQTIDPEANDGLVLIDTPYGPEWVPYQDVDGSMLVWYMENEREENEDYQEDAQP